jgi:nitrite transporter NirC
LWTSARATSDAAKCILIFWCLFAFIACGFEHSVANMTIFAVALLGNHPATVSFSGMAHNLAWVTLGNAIAGAFFMAGAYWRVNGATKTVSTAPTRASLPAAAE